jgi:Ca-activated chloride channel homolog
MTFAETTYGFIFLMTFVIGCFLYVLARRKDKKNRKLWGEISHFKTTKSAQWGRCVRRLFLLLGFIFLGIALARPQWDFSLEKREFSGTNIIFVLDTSKSMLANDVRPNRLELAKMSILELLKSLSGDQVGLIAFAGTAFLQCPSTSDYDAFKLALQATNTQIIPKGGTNLSAAMLLAAQTFDPQSHYKQIMLLTDGENLSGDAIKTAKDLATQGVVVHTIGIGSTSGTPISITNERGLNEYMKDSEGNTIFTKLDEATLQQIAQLTHGIYMPLGNAGEGLQNIYKMVLKSLPKESFESVEKLPIERYAWFAGIALILLALEPLFYSNRRRNTK